MTAIERGPTITVDSLDQLVRQRVEDALAERDAKAARKPKKLAVIATKGTLDWAYPPLILATTAKSLGWEAESSSRSTDCRSSRRTAS